jgi:hypothetical protein
MFVARPAKRDGHVGRRVAVSPELNAEMYEVNPVHKLIKG